MDYWNFHDSMILVKGCSWKRKHLFLGKVTFEDLCKFLFLGLISMRISAILKLVSVDLDITCARVIIHDEYPTLFELITSLETLMKYSRLAGRNCPDKLIEQFRIRRPCAGVICSHVIRSETQKNE